MAKTENGIYQMENGMWAYRFSILIDGKRISRKKTTDENGNKLKTKREATKAREVSKSLFGGGADNANMPTTTLTDDDFADDKIGLLDLLVKAGLAPSKGEGRRLVQQGGVSVDDEKVSDVSLQIEKEKIANGIIIKKGKKVFHKVTL